MLIAPSDRYSKRTPRLDPPPPVRLFNSHAPPMLQSRRQRIRTQSADDQQACSSGWARGERDERRRATRGVSLSFSVFSLSLSLVCSFLFALSLLSLSLSLCLSLLSLSLSLLPPPPPHPPQSPTFSLLKLNIAEEARCQLAKARLPLLLLLIRRDFMPFSSIASKWDPRPRNWLTGTELCVKALDLKDGSTPTLLLFFLDVYIALEFDVMCACFGIQDFFFRGYGCRWL